MNRFPNIERRESGPASQDRTADEAFETPRAALIPAANRRTAAKMEQQIAAERYALAAQLRDEGVPFSSKAVQVLARDSAAYARELMMGAA